MGYCDLCGTEADLIDAIVEGSLLSVCPNCARFGNVIQVKKPVVIEDVPTRSIVIEDKEVLIVKDYSSKVRRAREKLGLKQEELAKKIAERVSVIQKIESGNMKPSLELTKKLENFLKIKLTEDYKEEKHQKRLDLKDTDLTIGDLLELKK